VRFCFDNATNADACRDRSEGMYNKARRAAPKRKRRCQPRIFANGIADTATLAQLSCRHRDPGHRPPPNPTFRDGHHSGGRPLLGARSILEITRIKICPRFTRMSQWVRPMTVSARG
jgi:hypothetical protein